MLRSVGSERSNSLANCLRVFSDNVIVDDLAQAQLGGCAGCVCGRSCDSLRISDKQNGGE